MRYTSPVWKAVSGIISTRGAILEIDKIDLCCCPSSLDISDALYLNQSNGARAILEESLCRVIDIVKELCGS